MVKVEGRRIIRAPVQKVFQLVSRLEAAPRVTGLWLTADLIERKSNTLTVHYRGYFAGMPLESIQQATLHPPNKIEFRQTRGGLKTFRGQYQLKPIEGDTELALSLEAEVGIPLISEQAARLVLHSFIERSLEKFKFTAERDLPRVVRKAAEDGAKEAPAAQAPQADVETGIPEAEPQPLPGVQPPVGEAPAQLPAPQPPGQPGRQPAVRQAQPGGRRRRRRRRRRRGGGSGAGGGPASGPPPGRGGSG